MRITLVCECVVRDWYETTCVFQPKKIVYTMYAYELTFLIHGVCCGAPKSHGSTITCAFIPKTSTLTPPFIHKSKVSHAPWHCFNRRTEHRQTHIRDVVEDPNLVPIVTGGFRAFWLLINIYHIINDPPNKLRTHTSGAQ